jgi:serine/threonine-protein kinase HipA
MALLTGNGDLHLENLSISCNNGIKGFSRIYDPTPMRAYAQHDMLSVMPFGEYGETPEGSEQTVTLKQAIKRFAKNCGLSKTRSEEIVDDCLAKTSEFSLRVGELKTVPEENKERLINKTDFVRKKLME